MRQWIDSLKKYSHVSCVKVEGAAASAEAGVECKYLHGVCGLDAPNSNHVGARGKRVVINLLLNLSKVLALPLCLATACLECAGDESFKEQ